MRLFTVSPNFILKSFGGEKQKTLDMTHGIKICTEDRGCYLVGGSFRCFEGSGGFFLGFLHHIPVNRNGFTVFFINRGKNDTVDSSTFFFKKTLLQVETFST